MSYDVNSLEAHWMPFSANRDFKKDPRIVVKSEGMYMWDYKGGEIIDGSSALFCTPLGHGRREIAEAVYQQMLTNDYTPHFQLGHPGSFELAERVCRILPDDFNHVFFTLHEKLCGNAIIYKFCIVKICSNSFRAWELHSVVMM